MGQKCYLRTLLLVSIDSVAISESFSQNCWAYCKFYFLSKTLQKKTVKYRNINFKMYYKRFCYFEFAEKWLH